jgi:hypothetical protein
MSKAEAEKESPTKATIETAAKLAMEICQEINKIIFSSPIPGICFWRTAKKREEDDKKN